MNEKLKKHFQDHKELYIGIGVGICVASFTIVITRRTHASLQSGLDERLDIERVDHAPSLISNNNVTNIVQVLQRDGRGHPGYLIRDLTTNEIYPSQQAAAEAFDIPQTVLSDHLRGKFPDAHGKQFERIAVND